jgi:hypothetical protein
MTMSLVLIFLGVLCRVVPHPPNAVALGAVALYAGAKLPRRWAWVVPIGAMICSDIYLDWGNNIASPIFSVSRFTIYGTYLAIALLGGLTKRQTEKNSLVALVPLSLAGSLLFFVTTNFAEWIAGPLKLYPITAEGLVACYTAAIPFFQNTVMADLLGVGLLFGLDAFARRVSGARTIKSVELVDA